MNPTRSGWLLFAAALGMMLSLMSANITELQAWDEMSEPSFIGNAAAHLGAVIAAFVGGKMIPVSEVKK